MRYCGLLQSAHRAQRIGDLKLFETGTMQSFVTLRDLPGRCLSRRELMFLRLGQAGQGGPMSAGLYRLLSARAVPVRSGWALRLAGGVLDHAGIRLPGSCGRWLIDLRAVLAVAGSFAGSGVTLGSVRRKAFRGACSGGC